MQDIKYIYLPNSTHVYYTTLGENTVFFSENPYAYTKL